MIFCETSTFFPWVSGGSRCLHFHISHHFTFTSWCFSVKWWGLKSTILAFTFPIISKYDEAPNWSQGFLAPTKKQPRFCSRTLDDSWARMYSPVMSSVWRFQPWPFSLDPLLTSQFGDLWIDGCIFPKRYPPFGELQLVACTLGHGFYFNIPWVGL